MADSISAAPKAAGGLGEVISLLHAALDGPFRRDVVADAARAANLEKALHRLRDGMRRHAFSTRGTSVDLERPIQKYDRKTRTLGFHVLHDWDGVADRVNEEIIPVDVLHYLATQRGAGAPNPTVLAILLDYYYFHLLALLSLRIWDEGDPNANLDALARLVALLQSAHGSGQQFVADAETLILIATSHYELHERGYAVLLEKTRTLDVAHQLRIALGHGASMGSHLRFGFEVTYGRDTVNMRNDNVADYPWLCFALATLMQEYARLHAAGERGPARERIVESMLNGLSADARAIVGAPPSSLAGSEAERAAFAACFRDLKADLLEEFEPFRPKESAYSPLCFFFNFSHNVLKGTIVDALLVGRPWRIPFNALLSALPAEPAASPSDPGAAAPGLPPLQSDAGAVAAAAQARRDSVAALAETLMGYARANPHRIRGRLRPVIVYDVAAGRNAFAVTMKKLKE